MAEGALVVCVVVVVVVGAGFSTTVVHEVRSTAAAASSGVRMMSFFIVGIVPSMDKSVHVPLPDVFSNEIFFMEITCLASAIPADQALRG